ncbi:hypothetical protein [Streptomyces sp. LN325]|uniref:hypothetical protein n=1 Tax=Streptomyces sp. LN325 TaxID=3112976 RepID=UPI0037171B9A
MLISASSQSRSELGNSASFVDHLTTCHCPTTSTTTLPRLPSRLPSAHTPWSGRGSWRPGGARHCTNDLDARGRVPEVGKQWTDTGEIHEERDLKGRADGETRGAPGHPALTRILRQHIEDERLKPGDLLFQGENGGILAGSAIRRAWRGARKAVLPPHVFDSPTGRRVYDNRHTRLTKWLNDGIPPAQVADWAGNSVPVLLATYARCVDGQLPDLKRRLEAAGDLPELPDAD